MKLIRMISIGLGPEMLYDMDLVAAFGWQAKEFQKRMGMRCRLKLREDQVDLDKELSTAVFRIFQEFLTNIARHAKASSVDVNLSITEELLKLKVVEDGIGISDIQLRGTDSI